MQLKEVLKLSLIKELSNKDALYISNNFNSIDEALNTDISKILKFKLKSDELFSESNKIEEFAEEQLEKAEKNDAEIITIHDEKYPKLLKETPDPPLLLFVKGKLQNSDAVSISVVGTRRCTSYGKLAVDKFVEYFTMNNIIITSGMAYGIDETAHRTAVKHSGITYSVIASGLDEISTDRGRKLADKILENGGCVMTAYHFGVKALPFYFLRRNRIISGISKATLIAESGAKGGSLWTGKYCVEQNRELFAIPGNIFAEKCRGTNSLISKNLAAVAISPEKMLEDLGYDKFNVPNKKEDNLKFDSKLEEEIFNVLDHEPVHVDEICNKTGIDIAQIQVNLLNLEFKSYIKQLPGKLYMKI